LKEERQVEVWSEEKVKAVFSGDCQGKFPTQRKENAGGRPPLDNTR